MSEDLTHLLSESELRLCLNGESTPSECITGYRDKPRKKKMSKLNDDLDRIADPDFGKAADAKTHTPTPHLKQSKRLITWTLTVAAGDRDKAEALIASEGYTIRYCTATLYMKEAAYTFVVEKDYNAD